MADSQSFAKSAEVLTAIAQQMAEAPLYAQLIYKDQSDTAAVPATINLFCEKCDKETNWETYISPNTTYRDGFGAKEYVCRNCKTSSEEECVQAFDRVRFVFEYLFREIDARRRSAAEYAGAVAKIASQKR